MSTSQDSLFSLEVVVEKLYLPYATCRFPAVAFRLLDFPTILISHVEQELSDGIRRKINCDPYYRVPNQFAELQDKQGNFMVKKGKSCLFKISVDTLAMHLANTPMYIMVIDEFPEVPKLLGNSSLVLNEVMDAVKTDIKRNGHTVPSVHGDKGLFKIYSLMGKEIGYMIIGFRLLSLGPGMISHLPSSAFLTNASNKKKQKENPIKEKSMVKEIIEVKEQQLVQAATPSYSPPSMANKKGKENLHSTHEVGSMTDVEKCDVLMQTVKIDDEILHVAGSEKEQKVLKTIETQTERRKKTPVIKLEQFHIQKEESDSDMADGIIINPNIVCPPPLFYNSNAKPDVEIERDVNPYLGYSTTFDEVTLEDLSGDEYVLEPKPNKIGKPEKDVETSHIVKEPPRLTDARTIVISNIKGAVKDQRPMPQGLNLEALSANEPDFPLLTALLTELSKIQNPHFVNQAMQQVNQIPSRAVPVKKAPEKKTSRSRYEENVHDISEVDSEAPNVSSKRRPKRLQKSSATASEAVTKNKGFLKKIPEAGVKKTKLVFGLTNTQRLRLAKQNPTWLESAQKDENALKQQRLKAKRREMDLDLDTGNLSDTYTEVRRLAAKELEKTTLGRSQLVIDESKLKKLNQKAVRSRKNSPSKETGSLKENSPAKKGSRKRSHSSKTKKTASIKGTVLVREESDDDSPGDTGADLELEPSARDISSPRIINEDRQDSAADSVPSSRIEVHIPSARAYESDNNENTFSHSYEEDIETDRKDTKSKFPGFNRGDDTLPDSIAADGDKSLNTTLDDDSPLESTRMSKQFQPLGRNTGESLFKSTDDYDTKQFHSTDEPELQQLISEDEKSETQPTPITDRSIRSKSPVPATNTNTNRLSMKFEVVSPKASKQSPLQAVRRSQQFKVDSMNARPTPTETLTPRSRSSFGSPKQPTPRARKQFRERRLDFKKESIHTESVSSYIPSESENILSLISDGSYSDDFHMSSGREDSSKISVSELPNLHPSTKLGFTIS